MKSRTNARKTRAGMVHVDLTAEEVEDLDEQVQAHGGRSRAAYLRHLIKLHRPKTSPTTPRKTP